MTIDDSRRRRRDMQAVCWKLVPKFANTVSPWTGPHSGLDRGAQLSFPSSLPKFQHNTGVIRLAQKRQRHTPDAMIKPSWQWPITAGPGARGSPTGEIPTAQSCSRWVVAPAPATGGGSGGCRRGRRTMDKGLAQLQPFRSRNSAHAYVRTGPERQHLAGIVSVLLDS